MGIDAVMAVALKVGETPEKLNERFRETHSSTDTLIGDEYAGNNLILGKAPRFWDSCEYENTYSVNTGLSRYYDESYARGSCLKILLQLEWLRAQPEVVEVYYGGDCSDSPSVWKWEDSFRLLKNFFVEGHSSYAPHWAKSSWKESDKREDVK